MPAAHPAESTQVAPGGFVGSVFFLSPVFKRYVLKPETKRNESKRNETGNIKKIIIK